MMITQEMIDRINELARKSKTAEGLTDAEKEEQQMLRRAYIDAFKRNVRASLENIEFVDQQNIIMIEKGCAHIKLICAQPFLLKSLQSIHK